MPLARIRGSVGAGLEDELWASFNPVLWLAHGFRFELRCATSRDARVVGSGCLFTVMPGIKLGPWIVVFYPLTNCIELILLFLYNCYISIKFSYSCIIIGTIGPNYLLYSAYFEENKLIHQYNTRNKDDFHANVVASEFGKRAITYKGSKLWNSLPSHIKETPSSRSFKLALKNYLLQSMVQHC